MILVHTSYTLYLDCDFDKRVQWALVIYLLSHLALFSNFYFQSYLKKGRSRRGRSKGQVTNGASDTVKGTVEADVTNGQSSGSVNGSTGKKTD